MMKYKKKTWSLQEVYAALKGGGTGRPSQLEGILLEHFDLYMWSKLFEFAGKDTFMAIYIFFMLDILLVYSNLIGH